jgi:lysophospholipase L1-like esterase
MRLRQLLTASVITVLAACGGSEDDTSIASGSDNGVPRAPGSGDPIPAPPVPTTTPPAPTTAPPVTPPLTASTCFGSLKGSITGPDYDKLKPTIAPSCAGTHHQSITGVQKVVFLGDSVTEGTPPTLPNDWYRSRVYEGVKKRFGDVAVQDCAAWGARTDDFLEGKNQIKTCFPTGVEQKRTLVVMTMGGNDIAAWAKNKLSTADAMVAADQAADRLRAAIDWLKTPGRFPNGVYVVFANVYEYTDTSGNLASCPASTAAGMSGSWPTGAPAVVHFQERFMEVATATKTDMIFLLEHFCGHGYKRDDPSLQCYRGPGAELWFDFTCIHPTPKGHEQIANLFLKVIDGT